jgi:hypothetical protein
MQSVHDPQSSARGALASISVSVTSVPSTTHEPNLRVMSTVFFP